MTMISHYPFEATSLRDLSHSPQNIAYKSDIQQLQRKVRNDPSDVHNLRSLALITFIAEQYRTSYDCYVSLENMLPDNPEVLCGLARLFIHGGDETLGMMYYIKTIEADETYFIAHEELGDYYLLLEQYGQAKYFFSQMLNDSDAAGSGHFGLGLTELAEGNLNEAFDCFKKALSYSYVSNKCYHQLGIIAAKQSKWEDALDYFSHELVLDQRSYEAHFAMGRVYEEMDKPDQALSHYMETIKLEPELPEVYNNIATLYYNFKGDVDAALSNLEMALDQDPSVEIKMRVYVNLYRMHHQEGNYDQASHYYQLYVDASGFLEN